MQNFEMVLEREDVVINSIAAKFTHVILTQDWHTPGHTSFASAHGGKKPFETVTLVYGTQVLWPDHCVQGTPGADFHRDLKIPHAELIIRKGYRQHMDSYSAFFEADGEDAVEGELHYSPWRDALLGTDEEKLLKLRDPARGPARVRSPRWAPPSSGTACSPSTETVAVSGVTFSIRPRSSCVDQSGLISSR